LNYFKKMSFRAGGKLQGPGSFGSRGSMGTKDEYATGAFGSIDGTSLPQVSQSLDFDTRTRSQQILLHAWQLEKL
jgi:hypothetical protein